MAFAAIKDRFKRGIHGVVIIVLAVLLIVIKSTNMFPDLFDAGGASYLVSLLFLIYALIMLWGEGYFRVRIVAYLIILVAFFQSSPIDNYLLNYSLWEIFIDSIPYIAFGTYPNAIIIILLGISFIWDPVGLQFNPGGYNN